MPGMDGTGPMGNGPWGGGRGPCGRGQGRGRGQGAGNRFGGRGWDDSRQRGGWFGRIWGQQYPGPAPMADQAVMEEQVRMLESELQAAKQQLEAMGSTPKE